MEEERETTRYWCHECSRIVDPVLEIESVKCSLCQGGFVEEMDTVNSDHHRRQEGGSGEHPALSLWAPILLGMMNSLQTRRRIQLHHESEEESNNSDEHRRQGVAPATDSGHEIEPLLRQRRSSGAVLHLLQAGMSPESGDQERVILINPFNQSIIIPTQTHRVGSFGDYFVGPGFEQLIQHLSENDPNRYGSAPAQKEAIEAMPDVKILEGSIQCSVCLEDFDIGSEAKEMPCKHRFHGECILPWLELHSSCPVCRYQLPTDESKVELMRGSLVNPRGVEGESGNGRNGEGRRFSVSFPWPFSSLFSSSTASLNTGWGLASRAHEDDRGEHND